MGTSDCVESIVDKKIYFLALFVGSTIGAYVPTFFGVGLFSLWSIFSSAAFALGAIYLAFRVLDYWNK